MTENKIDNAMKIGVVSDTHSHRLPRQMLEDFKKVELILLVGDLCTLEVLGKFEKIAKVEAVHGNMDDAMVRQELPRRKVIRCGKFNVGLFHGEGPPATLLEKVKSEFQNDRVDAVIFGHSHQAFNKKVDGVLYFNPGSPNDTIFAPYQSYGILEINDEITGKIIKVKGSDE